MGLTMADGTTTGPFEFGNAAKTHRAKDDLDCHLAEARAFRGMFSSAVRGAE